MVYSKPFRERRPAQQQSRENPEKAMAEWKHRAEQ
jgi:hypothetical protein